MKVLHVISSLSLEGGGPAQGVRNLTSFYASMNVSPTVLTLDDKDDSLGNTDHLEVIRLGKGKGIFSYHPELVEWLKRHSHEYNSVVVHGLWQYHGYAVYKALKKSNIPYYVFPHGMLDPWFKHAYPLKHLKKYIYWFLAQYSVLKNSKAVLFTCEEEKLLARESFWPYRVNESVVNYGTTITEIAKNSKSDDFYTKYPELKNKIIFLFLSRIHEKKGCDLLIQAFAKIAKSNSDLHLVMAGPDQTGWQADLEKIADDYCIADRITWTGMIKNEMKWGAIKAAEVFILPSHQENFGISVAEALAVGTPVLISSKVNIWREIKEMNAGLVGDDTLEGTQKLLQAWLDLSENEKQIIKQNTVACYKQKFDISQAAKNLIELIRIN
ncbi:glycosyltransferase [Oceanobacter sp. 4_MG-2023]|uniref:glycosyltransferase n=1 Tax=Oceanobacter sp. 4_MG-2023 TaxID=3062623 RepID=UPI0027325BAD|nr:glycosyltransferase [Oceanobacter sp. 4_MG-2023]MDP2548524.1 glycosyltransferase [Oceanobacter sp. 4_MG-2023]